MKYTILLLTLYLLAGCHPREEAVRIATKPMTEQFILGEMLRLIIENDTGLKVEVTKGIGGGTSNIHPAVLKGDFDLYPEYTGTGWLVVLKKDTVPSSKKLWQQLVREYEQKYHLKWTAPYGLNNFSDLARYPNEFVFGAEYDFFEIHKGYRALAELYKLKFKKTRDMDIGLKYEAIKSGKVDVMTVFTTDGQLQGAQLTLLEDDKDFFPSYYCATVVREETLAKYPALTAALKKMEGILTNEEMSALNYQVDIAGMPEQEVARNFLQKKGLLSSESRYSH